MLYKVRFTDRYRYAVNDEDNRMSIFLYGSGTIVEGSGSIHSIYTDVNDAFHMADKLNRENSAIFNSYIDYDTERIDHEIETIKMEIKSYEEKLYVLESIKDFKLQKVKY